MVCVIGATVLDIVALATDKVEWSATRLGRFYLNEFVPNTFWIG